MSDRLSLAHAIEEATGLERAKAEQLASAIFVAIEGHILTKADAVRLQQELKADIAASRQEGRTDLAGLRHEIKADLAALRYDLTMRAIAALVAAISILFAALHLWPPHG